MRVEAGRDILLGCQCYLVMIGKIKSNECSLFLGACTPESPKGACMVSVEGTCNIWATYGVEKSKCVSFGLNSFLQVSRACVLLYVFSCIVF
ncbi:MAG: hydrogenase formation protein HypD [Candidatus Bathyarchaeota archaeon]|nr:hydrogenase formation protein HypD [Candidatus Bathyarchaeota archaeon]